MGELDKDSAEDKPEGSKAMTMKVVLFFFSDR
jgi:hypothetical protein